MAADAFFLLNYIDCIDEQALPGTVWTPDTLPPGVSGNRFSSTVDRVCPVSPINTLDSAPVVFRCAAQTLGLETFFFFCCSALFLLLARLLQTNGMCVCSGFCCFCCSRPFGYLYLQWTRRFLQTFRPKI